MSDEDPSTPLPVVDRPLQRRVAWGLLAGRSKAEIASAEGISDEALNAALIGPCMFMLVNIWGVFFKEGDRGDLPLLRQLVRWALDFVIENADRTQGAGIAKAFLIRVSFKLGFNSTLKLLCDHIEGVIGVQDRQTPLRGVRGRLVELMSWAIEIALMQLFIYQLGEEEIVRRDEYFREQILLQEFDTGEADEDEIPAVEVTPPAAPPTAPMVEAASARSVVEPVAEETGQAKLALVWSRPEEVPEAAASSAVGSESDRSVEDLATDSESARFGKSVASVDHAEPFAPWVVGSSPTMTVERTRDLCPALSWRGHESVERPPVRRNLLYDSVRFKRRRRSSPFLVRHVPIERAA